MWLAAFLAVIVGSLLPSQSAPIRLLARLPVSDKVLHFSAYALLAFLPVLYERMRTAMAVAAGLAAIGVLLELGQAYLGERFFEPADIAANGCGVIFGILIALPGRGRGAGEREAILAKGWPDR